MWYSPDNKVSLSSKCLIYFERIVIKVYRIVIKSLTYITQYPLYVTIKCNYIVCFICKESLLNAFSKTLLFYDHICIGFNLI